MILKPMKRKQAIVNQLAKDLGIDVRELTDIELIAFNKRINYIIQQYYTTFRSAIIGSHIINYLLGAKMAKQLFDSEFTNFLGKDKFRMIRLTKNRWVPKEDLVCISGFTTKFPEDDLVCYETSKKEHCEEIVWIEDNGLYVCILPYAKIIQPRESYKFPESFDFVGVIFTKRHTLNKKEG